MIPDQVPFGAWPEAHPVATPRTAEEFFYG